MMFQKISLLAIALTFSVQQGAFAQSCNLAGAPVGDLRDPLINGATSQAPFIPARRGMPPPVGDSSTPAPVTPGMLGPGTLLPWVPAVPANDIDLGFSGIPLGVAPAIETPPGVLGPLLTPVIPRPQSTPGHDPGNLWAPATSFNPAADELINPNGGIPGTGGFCTTIPTLRRGGQETQQFEIARSQLRPGRTGRRRIARRSHQTRSCHRFRRTVRSAYRRWTAQQLNRPGRRSALQSRRHQDLHRQLSAKTMV